MNIRTEKAIKAVIAKGSKVAYSIELKKSGNHSISFFAEEKGELLAKFTLKSIIRKRLAKKRVK